MSAAVDESFASVVRIFGSELTVVGAGFLVGERQVLTCAHAVAEALGISGDVWEPPKGAILLDFPLVARGKLVEARVTRWQPILPFVLPSGAQDVALLELESDPPEACPIARLRDEGAIGPPWRLIGFPPMSPNGLWLTGIGVVEIAQWLRLEPREEGLTREFAGSPVWDEETGDVVGMIVDVEREQNPMLAYMSTVADLIRAFPVLHRRIPLPDPYRGLFPFREEHGEFFFGRDEVVTRLIREVQVEVGQTGGVVTVSGPSGSGKSSVVFAGLVWWLRRQESWDVISLPGDADSPLLALVEAFLPLRLAAHEHGGGIAELLETADELEDSLQEGRFEPFTLVNLMRGGGWRNRLLLVVDQWEELYTRSQDSLARDRFVEEIVKTVASSTGVTLVMTHPEGFDPIGEQARIQGLKVAEVRLGGLALDDLRRVIERPAGIAGVRVEDALVDRLIDETGDEPGGLPLLELVLANLWPRQRGGMLTLADYEETGGFDAIVPRHAEEVYAGLGREEQAHAAGIFLRLVRAEEPGSDSARQARRSEFDPVDWDLVRHLAAARLLVIGRETAGQQETVEIAHRSLLYSWDRMHQWVELHRTFLLRREQLQAAMDKWEGSGHQDELLLRGPALTEAEQWLRVRADDLSAAEHAFVEASSRRAREEDKEAAGREAPEQSPEAQPSAQPPRSGALPSETPIEHVVIIVREGHTFDNYFGTFPGALGETSLPRASDTPTHGPRVGRTDWLARAQTAVREQYAEADVPAYFDYARQFTLCDNYFSEIAGPSIPNQLMLLAADSPLIDNPQTGFVGYGPSYELPSLPASLEAMGLQWRVYGGDAARSISYLQQHPSTLPSHQFTLDAAMGSLPAVSWAFAPPGLTEHPNESVSAGMRWTVEQVDAVVKSRLWMSAAIFIVWDSWGGWYDHVEPPQVESWTDGTPFRYGSRVGCLVVSPYAKAGYLSRVQHSHVSLLKFCETVLGVPPLNSRDMAADDMADCFDFSQTPLPPPSTRAVVSVGPRPAGVSTWFLSLTSDGLAEMRVGQEVILTLSLATRETPGSVPLGVPADAMELTVFTEAPGLYLREGSSRTIPVVGGRPEKQAIEIHLIAVASGERSIRVRVYPSGGTLGAELSYRVQIISPEALPQIPELIDRQAIPDPEPDVTLYVLLEETPEGEQLRYLVTCPILSLDRERLDPPLPLTASDVAVLREGAIRAALEAEMAAPYDVSAALEAYGKLLYDTLLPPEHPARRTYYRIVQAAPETTWTWLIVSDERACLPWEMVLPHGLGAGSKPGSVEPWQHDFWARMFVLAHWIGGRGLTLTAEAPRDRIDLAHYGQRPGEIARWQAALGGSSEVGLEELPGRTTLTEPGGRFHGLHVVRYADRARSGRVAELDARQDGAAGSARGMIGDQQLDFTLRRPIVGLSFVDGDAGGHDVPLSEMDTQIEAGWMLPFMHAQATALVGSRWPVTAEADRLFFQTFYDSVRAGRPLGQAVQAGREEVRIAHPDRGDWLAYVYFGHPWCEAYEVRPARGYALFEVVDYPEDEPFPPGSRHWFRASYRTEAPVWYEGHLRRLHSAPDLEELEVIVMPLTGQTAPETYKLEPLVGASGAARLVPIEMPEEEMPLPVVVRFQQRGRELTTLILDLEVRRRAE